MSVIACGCWKRNSRERSSARPCAACVRVL